MKNNETSPTKAADPGQDQSSRVKGVTIIKPIVYGNVAKYFGEKRKEDGHTHEWTVYLKPFHNEDMSLFIKKVQFKLHESYANQTRVLTKPPYEVTETGWGEFEVLIRIHFQDPNEKPVTAYHVLKLFQSQSNILIGKKNLVTESYDELIFQDPSIMMLKLLKPSRPFYPEPYTHEMDFKAKKKKDLAAIASARVKILSEITEFKEKLLAAKSTITKYREEIKKLEKQEENKEKI